MRRFDSLDLKILYELSIDSSISMPALSKKIDVSSSVLYSRLRGLTKKGLIRRFTIEIDDSLLGIGVKAMVGINRDPKLKESVHKSLLNTAEIISIYEVTGRFDMMTHVFAVDLDKLHDVVIEKIGKIKGIHNTETFVQLQKIDKAPVYLESAV